MNSYQRRQRRRAMVFGMRKLAAAAHRAAHAITIMVRNLEGLHSSFPKMGEPKKAA